MVEAKQVAMKLIASLFLLTFFCLLDFLLSLLVSVDLVLCLSVLGLLSITATVDRVSRKWYGLNERRVTLHINILYLGIDIN